MAPKKRKAAEVTTSNEAAPPPSRRTTRSSSRAAAVGAPSVSAQPPTKEAKPTTKEKGKSKEPKKTEKEPKKAEKEPKKAEKEPKKAEAQNDAGAMKTIVVEACKQCQSFKTRATKVKNGLENGVPGINVLINPESPRTGCFEIREEGGEIFISLLDMSRPFKKMKDLDMDKVISDIIEKIND
eukprot:TRINITY_DN409_c0_g8_i1.p1 TRINITY_DN409_c0_g8~~TRINITY_DN409_c0_g8_i1.p1  ORF type:complete len:211 (-),score=40.58 TRINITY_DN409_c0_g8_i1:5-553(-)